MACESISELPGKSRDWRNEMINQGLRGLKTKEESLCPFRHYIAPRCPPHLAKLAIGSTWGWKVIRSVCLSWQTCH